ncbi:MAG: hydroxylamine reductase, partial [Planctomycetes bacterium]|nr:hydroxylamine reductase [Planctomycetota bacterium]
MSMFCYQCQEAAKGTGCTIKGVCGKTDDVSNLQDLLLFVAKGVAYYADKAAEKGVADKAVSKYVLDALFTTITNANFHEEQIREKIRKGLTIREQIKKAYIDAGGVLDQNLPEAAMWYGQESEYEATSMRVGVLLTENEDVRSLRELLTYGLKGLAAYTDHALNLGFEENELYAFIYKALVATLNDNLSADELVALNMECGKFGVSAMALLDKANTESYGNPEITKVNIG